MQNRPKGKMIASKVPSMLPLFISTTAILLAPLLYMTRGRLPRARMPAQVYAWLAGGCFLYETSG